MKQEGTRAKRRATSTARERHIDQLGAQTVRFQEGAKAFDRLAADVLGLDDHDLPCMTLLLFGGPMTIELLTSALHESRSAVLSTTERLQLAGYARRRPAETGAQIELTDHARQWIMRLWEPLRSGGVILLSSYSTRQLEAMNGFMARACELQERHARRLRTWLALPASSTRKAHLRGGLSPAAMRRVQLFVDANLHQPLRLVDLAQRAGLSVFHFARAFRTSAEMTPRMFLEQRRVERAKRLIRESLQPLADIAIECGFGTQSHLTVTFKRRVGFTPAQYRRDRP